MIRVEVVYALHDRQMLVALELDEGATAGEAVAASGLVGRFLELARTGLTVGVYGRTVSLDVVLRDGDRVEIYRPLAADPKEARRKRAAPRTTRPVDERD